MANGLTNLQQMMSGINETLFGSEGSVEQVPTMTEEQQGMQSQILQQLPQLLQQAQQQGDFQPIEQQRRRSFEQQTLPTIRERFTAMSGGGQMSGALPQQELQAGKELETDLAGLQSQMQTQQQGNLMQALAPLMQAGFQGQTQPVQFEGQQGLLQALAPILGQVGGTLGTAAGAQALGLPLNIGMGTGKG